LAPSTRTAWPEWALANGYSVEQVAILKACIGKLTHSGPYLKSLAADLSGRHDVNGEFVEPVSVYDRHSAALTLHIRALAKAAEQRSEKTSLPRVFKPPPETAAPVMPPSRREAQQSQPPQSRAERSTPKRETIRLGGLSITEIEPRKAALNAAGR
jgi:hypothetical protein